MNYLASLGILINASDMQDAELTKSLILYVKCLTYIDQKGYPHITIESGGSHNGTLGLNTRKISLTKLNFITKNMDYT